MSLDLSFLQRSKQLLIDDTRIDAVWVLGSAAKGTMRTDSDIDLALLPGDGINLSFMDLMELSSRLTLVSGREVDCGILDNHNLVYAHQAIMTGQLLFTRNRDRSGLRSATLLGLYYEFNEDRQEVPDAWRT
jgi:predicted nucleotidyltransferase